MAPRAERGLGERPWPGPGEGAESPGMGQEGSCHDTRVLMGRTQTWEEAGRVGGLPGPEEQHLHLCLQWGREGHSGPHLQAWPHTLIPCRGTACLPAPSQLRARVGTLGPRGSWSSRSAFSKGSCQLGATTWTAQACPVTPPLCAQETPISDGCTKKSLQRAQPRGTEGLPGLSVDRALQGLMDQGCTHRPGGLLGQGHPACPLGVELHSSAAWPTAVRLPVSLLATSWCLGPFPSARGCCVSCGFASSRAGSSCVPHLP